MSAPTVTVILPTFNRLQYLRPALDSVFAQTCSDWELIVADDGSETLTTDYLRSVPRLNLIFLPHSGNPAKVRNAALREARGEYVAFMDSDDVWLPRKLEIQLAALRASGCRWSYTALTRVNDVGAVMSQELPGRRPTPGGTILRQLLTLEVAVATPAVMAERSLLAAVGGFDEQQEFFEEYDLWLRLNLHGPVCAVGEPLALVRNHDQHYSGNRIGAFRARLRLLDKMTDLTAGLHLEDVIHQQRARSAAALARAYVACGQSAQALPMLWQGRREALRDPGWWATAARVIAPARLREVVRVVRHRHRSRSPVIGRLEP